MKSENLIFLLSLPRTGSTLLQRLLATHKEIATTAEPMRLLPLIYAMDPSPIAEYAHQSLVLSTYDLIENLPCGKVDYHDSIRSHIFDLYSKFILNSERYFLDKSIPYTLICDKIIEIFPEAKYIVIFRNPLEQISSVTTVHGKIGMEKHVSGWNTFTLREHWEKGAVKLAKFTQKYSDKICCVKYRELIHSPKAQLERIFNYLQLDFDKRHVDDNILEVAPDLKGRSGDPTGIKEYNKLSNIPSGKWKNILNSPVRKAWFKRYLRRIGDENLKIMGYDKVDILNDLKTVKNDYSKLFPDIVSVAKSEFKYKVLRFLWDYAVKFHIYNRKCLEKLKEK